ncbi:MAG: hypothetical protein IPF99_36980 [Deltaproteobacteria bacterium]|nr:hypothetical protein [Deltaproteobacteria bacterium]MBP6832223.1 hypothetical protein [Deltaproteobacteria bacterium]
MIRRAACLSLLLGCVGNAPVEPPSLDLAMFASRVQPVLAARCASPACHGSERRRLRVYAPGFFRSDPRRVHRDEPITADELAANERSAAAFVVEAPSAAESLLVTKPLHQVAHLGAQVFTASDDEHATLLAWIRTGSIP